MKISRKLAIALHSLYKEFTKAGMLNDCFTYEEVACALMPVLSSRVDLARFGENYQEQILYFTNKLVLGEIPEYALVHRVVDTEPYITSTLEPNIRDVYAYMIIPVEEIDICDKVIETSISYNKLQELKAEYEEEDRYADAMIRMFYY